MNWFANWLDPSSRNQLLMSLYDSMGTVVGVLLGIIVGVLVCLLHNLVFHPTITFIWRFLHGDHVASSGNNGPEFKEEDKAFALVLSDLHVDTWEGEVLKQRTQALEKILSWGAKCVDRLIVNGDLLDAPPHPNNQKDPNFLSIPRGWPEDKVKPSENLHNKDEAIAPGILQSRFVEAIALLQQFPKPTISTVGNHDIGINGLRAVLPGSNLSSWVPGIMFETDKKGKYVFMEHGHLHDPILWIYIAYSLIDLLARGDAAAGGQKGGRVGKAGGSTIRTKDINSKPGTFTEVTNHVEKLAAGERLTRFAYRMAAYRRHRELKFHYRRQGIEIVAVLLGHTHIPDRFQLTKDTVYVNIGDWAGNKEHQTFALIKNEGEIVGPITWK